MRKFLSIFMSLVMVVTMLPKVSFAVEPTASRYNALTSEEENNGKGDDIGPQEEGVFKFLQDKFSLFTVFLKEKAPYVWEKIESHVDEGKEWCADYYKNVSEFASKVGALGIAATVGLSALAVKVVWEVLKFIVALFGDDESKQADSYASNSSYLANSGQVTTYTYSTGGYQTPCSYGYVEHF